MAKRQHEKKDYCYSGAFDSTRFQTAYVSEFKGVEKFNLASIPDLLFLLGKVGGDPRIADIRWSAYLLATAFIESSHTVRITKKTVDRKGRVKFHRVKVWRNFSPIEEIGHGKGHPYAVPVKVARLSNGDARVTEYDGDQWIVSATGRQLRPLHENQSRGLLRPDMSASPVYENDDGTEEFYFGRGYVQLTWWNTYVSAGITLGRGLAFLLDPNLVDDRDVAYEAMATGLCTGKISESVNAFETAGLRNL